MKKIVAFVLVLIFSISLLTTSFAITIGDFIARGICIGGVRITHNNACYCPRCGAVAVLIYGPWTHIGPNNSSSALNQRTRRIECINGHCTRLEPEYR